MFLASFWIKHSNLKEAQNQDKQFANIAGILPAHDKIYNRTFENEALRNDQLVMRLRWLHFFLYGICTHAELFEASMGFTGQFMKFINVIGSSFYIGCIIDAQTSFIAWNGFLIKNLFQIAKFINTS